MFSSHFGTIYRKVNCHKNNRAGVTQMVRARTVLHAWVGSHQRLYVVYKYLCQKGSATRLAGVRLEVNLRNPLWTG